MAKPGSVNVTTYTPGRRSTILYSPLASVTTTRTFSIRAGLAASTVTPGNTAPVVSLATPAMLPVVEDCAQAAAGKYTADNAHRTRRVALCMNISSPPGDDSAATAP